MLTCKSLGRTGRFGNQCFQVAGVIGIATKNNHTFCFPRWINYDHKERFGSDEDIDIQKFFENPLPEFVDINYNYRWIDWGYHDIRLGDGAHDLCGHFQSEKYFSHCIDTVRYYLRMKDEYPFLPNTCAIHWRAGDYTESIDSYHPRQPKSYYNEAIKRMPPGTQYIVFTDDREAAKEMFPGLIIADGDYIGDFKLMKACNHFICANSSYSLMAAILCEAENKIVVCPKVWFGSVAGINGNDCYPENAIII